jgi:chromate reductase
MEKINILAFGGSLRKQSFNNLLLKAAQSLASDSVNIEIAEVGNLPLFNQDFEMDLPVEVKKLKEKVKAADAILFCSPEYNYSIPGVLKNAIDWVSRPYGDNSFEGKPVAIMGGSPGMTGTARMQYHLRQVCVFLNAYPLNKPEVMVPSIHEKFDKDGNLTDEHTKEKIKELLEALAGWTKQLKK